MADNIYRIPVPLPHNPLGELNAYLIRGERNLLVDTGFRMDECREALAAGLEELGVSMETTDIFLTHLHTDHTGLAPELASASTRVLISEYDRSRMPGRFNQTDWSRSDGFFRRNGMPETALSAQRLKNPMHAQAPLPYDDYLAARDGDTFHYGGYTFQALATPGHTPGHLCLWDKAAGILFSGDHVLYDITPNLTQWLDVEDALGDYVTSLRAVQHLPVRLVLPGHRRVHGTLSHRVQALLDHHEARCREALAVIRSLRPALPTAWDVAARLTWDIRAKSWADFPVQQQWFALGETLAHLEHLRCTGKVARVEDGDLVRWNSLVHK